MTCDVQWRPHGPRFMNVSVFVFDLCLLSPVTLLPLLTFVHNPSFYIPPSTVTMTKREQNVNCSHVRLQYLTKGWGEMAYTCRDVDLSLL